MNLDTPREAVTKAADTVTDTTTLLPEWDESPDTAAGQQAAALNLRRLLDLAPALKAQAAFAGMGLSFGGNRLLRGHL